MVIEDSATVRAIVGAALAEAGYHVILTSCYEEAMLGHAGINPSIVVSDLIMPGIGGIAGIALLRQTSPNIGIIAMSAGSTSYDAASLLLTARQVGAHEILKKPFSKDSLVEAVKKLLSQGFGKANCAFRRKAASDSDPKRPPFPI